MMPHEQLQEYFLKSSKTFKLVMWDGGTQFSAVELPLPW